jgi:NNP family nitrate/nitrite transporter-like MFS transporter
MEEFMKKSNYMWVILIVACVAQFTPNYSQYQLSPMAPQLMESFGLSMTQFSSLFTAAMIPAIFLGIISGLLVDKYGFKIMIGIPLVISAIGLCLRVTASTYTGLLVAMVLTGVGVTFLNSNGPKLMGSFFPPEKITTAMSILLATSTLAMSVAMATTGFFASIRSAFIFAAVLAIIAAVLWFIFVKNPEVDPAAMPPSVSVGESLKLVMKCKPIWIAAVAVAGIMACNVGISSFLPTALVGRGIDSVAAGMYGSIMTIGCLIGTLLGPVIANAIGKTKPAMIAFALVAAVGGAFFWQLPVGFLLGAGMLVYGAAVSASIPLLMSLPVQLDEIGPVYAGTAGGFLATIQLIGAVVVPTYVITPIAGANMNMFFILSGGCMIITMLLIFFLPEVMKKAK